MNDGPQLLLVGHGFLGQEIGRRFRDAGWAVSAVSLGGGDGELAFDVADRAAVDALAAATARPDFIVHCAASGRGGADAYRRVYVSGCRNLAAVFPGVRLLFTSSSSVYGQTDGSLVSEESPAKPDRETGEILLEAERVALEAGGIVARFAGIYGPERSVILRRFLSGEAILEEDGRRFLNQIHRDDGAAAVLHLAADPARHAGEVYNVADSEPLSQLECYRRLALLFGRPLPPSGPRDANRKRGWTHKRVSNAKLRGTGWEPGFPCFTDAVRAGLRV
jgi:nucleoside-diphosphate-sugar epimerase